jgi:hypothetical protein
MPLENIFTTHATSTNKIRLMKMCTSHDFAWVAPLRGVALERTREMRGLCALAVAEWRGGGADARELVTSTVR